MLLAQQAEKPPIGGLLIPAQQQHAGRAALADVQVRVLLVPLENGLSGDERLAILLVHRPQHDQRRRGAVRQVLVQPQPDFRLRHRHEPPGVIDEAHAQVEAHLRPARN